jgi:hypothetical protein
LKEVTEHWGLGGSSRNKPLAFAAERLVESNTEDLAKIVENNGFPSAKCFVCGRCGGMAGMACGCALASPYSENQQKFENVFLGE